MNFTLFGYNDLTPESTIALWKLRRIQGLVWLSCNIISDKNLYHCSWSLSKANSGINMGFVGGGGNIAIVSVLPLSSLLIVVSNIQSSWVIYI